MEQEIFNIVGLPKPRSLSYAESLEYYKTNIATSKSPIPIILDNGSFEFRAVTFFLYTIGLGHTR